MTTLRDRPEPGAGSGGETGSEAAHCPHCGGLMETDVSLPWPGEPVLCGTCERWVGRARAIAAPTASDAEAAPVVDTPAAPGGGRRGHTRRRAPRPAPAERRRARELGPPPVPRFLASDDQADETTFQDDAFAATSAWDAPIADPPGPGAPGPGVGDALEPPTGGANGAHGHAAGADGPPAVDPPTALAPAARTGDDLDENAAPASPAPIDEPVDDTVAPSDHPGADATEPVESVPAPESSRPLPFWSVPSQPEPPKRRLSLRRLRRPRLRRPTRAGLMRALPVVLLVVGGLLLVEGALTVLWKEPFSALFAAQDQSALGQDLEKLERESEEARTQKEFQRLERRRSVALNRETADSKPIGRLRVDKIDLNEVVVQGTDEDVALKKGPGHYVETPLPGQKGNWTVGIAGHRTTYGAPFRNINELEKGDKIVFSVPYGRYTYEVDRTKIVDAGYTKAFVPRGEDQIVLTACHPLYSAAQRILVYGKLKKSEPRRSARGGKPA